jgi:hypothetical protein
MLSAFLLLALQAGAQARGPEVMVGVDKDRVAPGDVLEYTITARSDLSDPIRVDMPPLGGFELEARTERTDVNLDGSGGRTTVIVFRLRATQPGEWRLGPVQVHQGSAYARGDAILVTITGGGPPPVTASLNPRLRALVQRAPPPGALGAAGISVLVSDPVATVGQQVDVVTIAWFERDVRQQLRRAPTVESPQVEGVWTYPQPAPSGIAASRQVNGKWYDLFVLHQVAFPLTPGTLTVSPARLQYSLPLAYQFFSQEERYRLASEPARVTVRPLPAEGREPGFTGTVGRGVRVSQAITPAHGKQGEAFTAEVTVRGQGNVALWPQPDVRWPAGVRVYPEASREQVALTDGWLGGGKTFRFLLVADSAGTIAVPPIRYSYFDPGTGRYEAVTGAGTNLVVAPRGDVPASRAEPPPIRLDRGRSITQRIEGLLPGWAWLLVALLPPLMLAGQRVVPRVRARAARVSVTPRAAPGEPLGVLERRLAMALEQLVPEQADLSDDALAAVLRGAGLDRKLVETTIHLRHRVREARYAPGAREDRTRLGAEVEALLPRLAPRVSRTTRRWRDRAGLAGAVLLALALPLEAQTPPEQLYDAGAYRAAAEGFKARALREPDAPNHWLNFGNAAWRGGDDAQALAAWVRGARLRPRDQGFRRALLLVPPGDQWAARNLLVSPVTPAELRLFGLVLWLAGWAGIAWSRGLRGRWLVLLAGGVISAGAGIALDRWYGRPVAVVSANQVLRLSPHEQAPAAGEVARVGTVLLEERRGAWMRVRAAGGQEGWVAAQELRPAGMLTPR